MSLTQNNDEKYPKRIHLLGDGRHEEGLAGGAVNPGHLVKLNSDDKYVVHATAGGAGEKAFAIEDALQGRTIRDNYASGERVSLVLATPGDVIYGWLEDGETVVKGDLLKSAGNGNLAKQTGSTVTLAIALEAVDLSASANLLHGRIRVRIV